jgi:pilus assembly protein Flp/PilA
MWKVYELASALTARMQQDEGQTLVEYAFLIAFIATVAIVAMQLLGTNVSSLFSSVANAL